MELKTNYEGTNLDNELNQRRRAQALSLFLDTKQAKYLEMVARTGSLLRIALGADKACTLSAEGIMHEIFCDIIDGTRVWDEDNYNLEQILWTNIRSEVSALTKKEKRYVLTSNSQEGDESESNQGMDEFINDKPDDIEGNIDAENIENYCSSVILKDDEDAQIVFNEMLTGKKQKQIAEYLGISVEKAETTIRGIKRKISKQIPFHMIENLPFKLINKIINQS